MLPRDGAVTGAGDVAAGFGCRGAGAAFGAALTAGAFGAAGFAGAGALAFVAVFAGALAGAFFDAVFAGFFGALLAVFLAVFFAADFLTAFFAVFLAFLATRPVLAERFLAAAFLVTRTGETFFVFFAFFFAVFLDDFVLAVATTNSFADQIEIVGSAVRRSVYRVASASIENTEKTSGLRSRL
ncbi:hypothetical protein ACFFWD_04900 [Bradyrhizobium erythrophlei]|uniref:hypothetical protein n=1 Tax=Bradyrhizobium erythrophlei TaxID=1437360 RepID=UPI0035EB26C0